MKRTWTVVPAEFRRSRLLLAYLAIGIVSGLAIQPLHVILNYALLFGYVALISWWFRREPALGASEEIPWRPRRDLAVVAIVALLALAVVSWFWFGAAPLSLRGELFAFRDDLLRTGANRLVAVKAANAVLNMLLLFVPAVIVSYAAGLRRQQLALLPRGLGLGLLLSLISAGFGFVGVLIGQPPLGWTVGLGTALAILILQAGINGLPEEFIFRGVIFPRLLTALRSPATALVLSSMLFNAFHIPSDLAQAGHQPWWGIILYTILSPSIGPTGLVWGYLCYRARSIWPGVIWHTSATNFGLVFW